MPNTKARWCLQCGGALVTEVEAALQVCGECLQRAQKRQVDERPFRKKRYTFGDRPWQSK